MASLQFICTIVVESNLGASVQMYGGSHTLVYIGGAEGLESFQGV